MTSPDVIEAEALALIGETIGELELIVKTAMPIDKLLARKAIILCVGRLEQVDALLLRLP
jgi:hypothetical protein